MNRAIEKCLKLSRNISLNLNFMKRKLIELLGWYGTVAIIGSFALASFSILQPTGLLYQLLNLTGAVGVITISLHKKVYQSVVLNIVWIIIALVAILRIIFKFA